MASTFVSGLDLSGNGTRISSCIYNDLFNGVEVTSEASVV